MGVLALVGGVLGYPLGAASPAGAASTTLPGGTGFSVTIDTPAPSTVVAPGLAVFAGQAILQRGNVTPDSTLIYALDVSDAADSQNGSAGLTCGSTQSIFDCERAYIRRLHQPVGQSPLSIARVGAVVYAAGGDFADVSPARNVQLVTGPTTDSDGGGQDIMEVISSAFTDRDLGDGDVVGGVDRFTLRELNNRSTSLAGAISNSVTVANAAAQRNTDVALMSSGRVSDAADVPAALAGVPPNVHFYVFAVGRNATCNSTLQLIADRTGGQCITPGNPDDGGAIDDLGSLPEVLRNAQGSVLDALTISVDGGPPQQPTSLTELDATGIPVTVTLPQPGPITLDWGSDLTDLVTAGQHNLCVTATGHDAGGSGTVNDCRTLVVDNPPTADPGGPYSGFQDTQIPITGTATDPDSTTLQTRWDAVPGPAVTPGATCTFADPTALSTTVSCNAPGQYTLTLAADDTFVRAEKGTTLTVANLPPVVSAGGPYTGTASLPVALTGVVTDPDSPNLAVTWSVTPPPGTQPPAAQPPAASPGATTPPASSPPGGGTPTDPPPGGGTPADPSNDPAACSFTDPTALATQITCPTPGQYTLTLRVSDGDNEPVVATTGLTIVPQRVPVGSVSVSGAASPGPGLVGGDPVLVTFTVRNDGELPMPGIQLTTTLPAALAHSVPQPAVLAPPGGPACRIGAACQLGTLQPGQRRIVRFSVQPNAATEVTVRATLSTTGPDTSAADNAATVRVQVRQPVLTVDPTNGRPGLVVRAVGRDFPAAAVIRLTWSTGLSQQPGLVVVDRDGTFIAQALVFNHDTEGPRLLVATIVRGPRFGPVSSNSFLVLARQGLQPPFDPIFGPP
jgi:hypothetical protein